MRDKTVLHTMCRQPQLRNPDTVKYIVFGHITCFLLDRHEGWNWITAKHFLGHVLGYWLVRGYLLVRSSGFCQTLFNIFCNLLVTRLMSLEIVGISCSFLYLVVLLSGSQPWLYIGISQGALKNTDAWFSPTGFYLIGLGCDIPLLKNSPGNYNALLGLKTTGLDILETLQRYSNMVD